MTDMQITLAAQLWNKGHDTLHIAAVIYGSSDAKRYEPAVYNYIGSIRNEARAMKTVRAA